MWVTKEDLATHLRNEQIAAIARDDETIVEAAIDGAVAEAKGYLEAFDRDTIFTTEGADRNQLLLIFVKDIAVYHLIILSNVNTGYEMRKQRYERAIKWLESVQGGQVTPDLPIKKDESGNAVGTRVKFGGNTKREQHF